MLNEPTAGDLAREQALIADARDRRRRSLKGRDRRASILLGASFLAAAVGLELARPAHIPIVTALILLGLYLASSSVEFEIGNGVALASELAIVPMFLLLPPACVPLLLAAGVLLQRAGDLLSGRLHPERVFVLLASSWYAIGPALVLTLAGSRSPSWTMVPFYVAALAAQLVFDLAGSLTRESVALGHPLRPVARTISWAYLVDVMLAPIGLLAAFAAVDRPYVLASLLFPCALLAMLARDRRSRIDHTLELVERTDHVTREARQDALTGLANRRVWEEAILASGPASRETDRPTSVILLDLDDLKTANDTYGHTVGDQLISELAAVLTATIRSDGLVARIGGDEIGILLPGTNELGCLKVVHRLRANIGDHPGVGRLSLSVSIGHASTPPADSLEQAIRLADERMYVDKHGNRRSSFRRPNRSEGACE